METKAHSWLEIGGKADPKLAQKLSESVREKIQRGEFLDKDVRYVSDLSRPLISETLNVSDQRLQKLRTLCQLWDVDIKGTNITSHRKYVGPIIVAFKRALLPIVKVLLKDTINQQRDFNAASISLLTDLANEIDRKR